ncbi:glucuronide permease [Streptococcus sp. oral taxon 431]|uniref:glucuronide permease n=1 Tax=Streptococcus sp. oral taxon 431 TaxID=712633 RepID=UPI002002BB46|nr:glucuronide permease [Streptococcus sp. oral taxon 431]
MNFVIILAIFLAFLVLSFPLLHLLASLSELRKGRNLLGNRLLLIGSSLATLSIFLYFFLPIVALSLWLIGCGVICYGAYWNDKQKENFKKLHHIIRITFAIVLTLILLLF